MTDTTLDLPAILADHKNWLNRKEDGKRADLSGADLSGADLINADLSRSDLYGANLTGANLSCADLSRADLSCANLSGADLSRAILDDANLPRANLYGAILDDGSKLIGDRPIIMFGPIGSEPRTVIGYMTDQGIRIKAGCFFGDEAAFRAKVEATHGDNQHAREYLHWLDGLRLHAELWTPAPVVETHTAE